MTDDLESRLKRCILENTNEATDSFHVFGTPNIIGTHTNVRIPFLYRRRLFLAIYWEDFVIAIEDNDLNIRVLIEDFWDSAPISYLELPFLADFVEYITDN